LIQGAPYSPECSSNSSDYTRPSATSGPVQPMANVKTDWGLIDSPQKGMSGDQPYVPPTQSDGEEFDFFV